MNISICVPCYEMHGKGVEYLHILLYSLTRQTFKNYEVILSDQSQNEDIHNVYLQNKDKFDISYHKCERLGKSSYNLNNAIKHAKHPLIKPIFQDDFILEDHSLEYISNVPTECNWGGIGFTHFDEHSKPMGNTMLPRYNLNMKNGVNTFGSPSVCFFKNDNNYFKDELVWLMDCEFYENMFRKYGNPCTINSIGIGVRLWGDSYTNHISEEIKNKETEIVRGLYG